MEAHETGLSAREYTVTENPARDDSHTPARPGGGRFGDETDMQVGETAWAPVRNSATVTSIRRRPDGSHPTLSREDVVSAEVGASPDRPDDAGQISSGDILNLLREYRAAEMTSRREARRESAMGETDLLAMRLLVDAAADGHHLTPGAIASSLAISTASTTALVDRLSSAGFVERRPHETDRRSTVIVPTVRIEKEVREALGRGQANIARVADDMSQHEIDVVARFLTSLINAVRDDPEAR